MTPGSPWPDFSSGPVPTPLIEVPEQIRHTPVISHRPINPSTIMKPKHTRLFKPAMVFLAVVASPTTGFAVDYTWTGTTGTYNNAAGWGGAIPGSADNAFVDNGGTVQINLGDPDWSMLDVRAGNAASGVGTFIQNGQIVTTNGWLRLGVGVGSSGTYTLNGGTLNTQSQIHVGEFGSGTLDILGGTLNRNANTGNPVVIGDRTNASGAASHGTVNHSAGTFTTTSELWIANGSQGVGTEGGIYKLSGTGVLNISNWFAIGRLGGTGVFEMTGGTVNKTNGANNVTISTGTNGSGTVNQSGGTFNNTASLTFVGESWNGDGSGTWNLSGTGLANLGVVRLGNGGASKGTFNLDGGTLSATQIATTSTGASNFNFNGGTLRAGATQASFMQGLTAATVKSGGAVIDSNNFNIGIAQSLLDGGGGGGLTKTGVGTLSLSGTNTYTGNTTVTGGALVGATTASLPGWNTAGKVSVAAGAAYGARLGTGGVSDADFATLLATTGFAAGSLAAIDTTIGNYTYATDLGTATAQGTGIGLYKSGANNLSLDLSAQTFTGNIVTNGGALVLSTSAPRTFSSQLNSLSGNVQIVGPGTLTLNGTQPNTLTGELWIGSSPNVPASLVLDNTTLTTTSWVALGRGNGSTGATSSLTVTNSTVTTTNFSTGFDAGLAANLSTQVVSLSNSTWTNNGSTFLAESLNSTTTMTVSGSSVFNAKGRFNIGLGAGSQAFVTIEGNGQIVQSAGGWISIGNSNSGQGTLTVKDNGIFTTTTVDFNVSDIGTSKGWINISDSATVNIGGIAFIGKGSGTAGTVNQSGGTFTGNEWISIGRYSGSTGVVNVSGGTFNQPNATRAIIVGEEGSGTLSISGGGAVTSAGTALLISNTATGTGIVNLDGGTLTAKRITSGGTGAGSATLNFNGGTLVAGTGANSSLVNNLDFAYVKSGGAVINSNSQSVAVDQALLADAVSTGGGLTKTGAGTLTLGAANTYTGPTKVTAGTLALGASGSIAASTTIEIAPGATLDTSAATGWSLAAGQTLTGRGSINSGAGGFTIASGATLAPGSSPGTLDVLNTLTFQTGSTFAAELETANAPNSDLVNVTGDLVIDAAVNLALSVFGPDATLAEGTKFTLIDYSGTWNGTAFSGVADGSIRSLGVNQYLVDYNDPAAGGSALTFTVVPEPATGSLIAIPALLLCWRRRRPA